MVIEPDLDPDVSYLKQKEFQDRLREYKRGDFEFVGINASVRLHIPTKAGGYSSVQTIRTPGLWGIESDSGNDYFEEVYREECAELASILRSMGVRVTGSR